MNAFLKERNKMPYSIKKQDCKNASGEQGHYVVLKKGKRIGCCKSKDKADAMLRGLKGPWSSRNEGHITELNEAQLRQLISYYLEIIL